MRPVLSLFAAFCLVASAPPGWFPGAGLLVLPGLAAFYALTTSWRRPYLMTYLLAAVHILAFSASLRHVVWGGYVAIGVLGAVYYCLAVLLARTLARWMPGSLAFAVGLACTYWLRALQPEVPYPHGQPIHCLYHWPALMGSVGWGGEVLGNVLLTAAAAACVDLFRAWRLARPAWRASRNVAGGLAVVLVLTALVRPPAAAPAADAGEVDPVRIAALQPNLHPLRILDPDPDLLQRHLFGPTTAIAGRTGRTVAGEPDLVLWPETSYPSPVDARGSVPRMVRRAGPALMGGTRLLAGSVAVFEDRKTPVAALLDERGLLVGMHEKRVLVPAGEFLPFVGLLPETWREALMEAIRARMAAIPDYVPGEARPLLETDAGMPFGAMLCYDNAFPWVAAEQVAAGARFLVVLSNEGWYLGGDELAQLEAMTVCRALETQTPVVRCTLDGSSLALDAAGRTTARLPWGAEGPPETQVMWCSVVPGPGAMPPLAWLHELARWVVALAGGLALGWRLLGSWARLLRAPAGSRQAPGGAARAVP